MKHLFKSNFYRDTWSVKGKPATFTYQSITT